MASSGLKTFMDDGERLLRAKVAGTNYVFWRGMYPYRYGREEGEAETLVVGLSDDRGSNEAPTISVLTARLDGSRTYIELRTGGEDDTSSSTPFGGGWDPLEELEKIARKLPPW